MPILSAVIIVKDEEQIIERCLKSVAQFADEIVVVDTGSQDATMELARKYTQHVYASEKFDKDTHFSDFEFGVAKNEAIRKCTGDWILWSDADDVFGQEAARKIKQLARTAERNALYSFMVSFFGSQFEHTRMFPSGLNILFDETHACHEYLLTRGFPIIIRKDIVIEHLPGKKPVPSSVRNLAILEKDYYERCRNDTRTMFYLANAYREQNKKKEAVEFYDRYLEKSIWSEERLFARIYKAQCLPLEKALKEYYRALAEDDRYAEVHCGIGDVLFNMKLYRMARRWYEMAAIMSVPKNARLFVTPSKYNSYPKVKIMECQRALGGTDERFSFPVDQIKGVRVVHRDRATERENERQMLSEKNSMINVELPFSWSGALMATQAILVKCSTHRVNVITRDEEIVNIYSGMSSNLSVNASAGDFIKLELPQKLDNEHAAMWYAKQLDVKIEQVLPVISSGLSSNTNIIQQLMYMGDFVALQTCPDSAVDKWSKLRWTLVVQHLLAQGLKIVQLDRKDGKIAGTITFDGCLASAHCVISMCKMFLGSYGWATHLAAAISKPAIILWGGTSVDNYGYAHHTNIYRNIGCHNDCHNHQPCSKMICTDLISVRTVLRELEKKISASLAV